MLHCFWVSKNVRDKGAGAGGGEEEGGSITIFCQFFFVSVSKYSVGESFSVSFVTCIGGVVEFWFRVFCFYFFE